jgi:hypothetical protein
MMVGSAAGVLAGYPQTRLVRRMERLDPRLALAVVAVCLATIALMARLLNFNTAPAFTFGILLTSLLCGVVIVVGRGMQRRLAQHREPRILSWLAETSYSLYLFHWPALIVLTAWGRALAALVGPNAGPAGTAVANLAALAVTFVAARLSYRYVEKPFSAGGDGPARLKAALRARRVRATVAAGAGVVILLNGFALVFAPTLSTMDADLRQGKAALSASRLEEAHTVLAGLDAFHESSGAVYVGLGLTGNIRAGSVTMVGDSVAIFPGSAIAEQTGGHVDVEGGRGMDTGVRIILSMQANGTLGEDVIVALATNTHANSFAEARGLCEQIAAGHRLIFVTAHGVGDADMAAISANLRTLPSEFPFVTIADWDVAIAAHEDWLAADGYHCGTQESVDLYVQTVLDALQAARSGPLSGAG